MRTNKRAFLTMSSVLLIAFQLEGCQALTGLDELEPQALIKDGGPPEDGAAGKHRDAGGGGGGESGSGGAVQAGTGGAAGTGGSGGSGGTSAPPPCPMQSGDECNLLENCGCADDQHCQARGSEYKATCVADGPVALGSPCKSPDECAEGTCDHGTCSKYCEGSCSGGQCLPIKGTDGKPVVRVNVCWTSCQVKDPKSCPDGTACQVVDTPSGEGAFCIPPANPCPTVEDGKCDEPNACAAGTDTKDCSCMPTDGATCDLVDQCGCPKEEACLVASSNGYTPQCQVTGMTEVGNTCDEHTQCRAGAGCYGQLCKEFCESKEDCPGELDQCLATSRDGVKLPVNACMSACTPSDPSTCKKDAACETFLDGSFCVWCKPELEGATCNLARDCGCAATPGTSCGLTLDDNDQPTTYCRTPGSKPVSTACEVNSECGPGSLCVGHVCQAYCASDADCADGACSAIAVNGVSAGIGVCNPQCSPATSGSCGPGTACMPTPILRLKEPNSQPTMAETITTCVYVPLTTSCPTTNQRCDEPSPKGNGLCAAGFDTAECM